MPCWGPRTPAKRQAQLPTLAGIAASYAAHLHTQCLPAAAKSMNFGSASSPPNCSPNLRRKRRLDEITGLKVQCTEGLSKKPPSTCSMESTDRRVNSSASHAWNAVSTPRMSASTAVVITTDQVPEWLHAEANRSRT